MAEYCLQVKKQGFIYQERPEIRDKAENKEVYRQILLGRKLGYSITELYILQIQYKKAKNMSYIGGQEVVKQGYFRINGPGQGYQ